MNLEQIKALTYLKNISKPVLISHFDSDFEPIGKQLRDNLLSEGLILQSGNFITIDYEEVKERDSLGWQSNL